MVRDTVSSHDVLPHEVWWSCRKKHKWCALEKVFVWSPKSRSQWPSYGTWHSIIPRCTTTRSLV